MFRLSMNKRSLDMDDGMDKFGDTYPKRQQLGAGKPATRVLLLRNLARGVTELDVEAFVKPFTVGYKPKVFVQASTGRAFVEFTDEKSACEAFDYFSQHPIQLKGTNVQVTFSKHNTVTTQDEKLEPYRVLLASVTNLIYPVDIDLMYYLFSKYGQVEKIVTFSRTPTMYQALIQFQSADDAKDAMVGLHNRNIYDGCNTLQIQPSRLNELVVKSNSPKSWDYSAGQVPVNSRGSYSGYGNNLLPNQVPRTRPQVTLSNQLSMIERLPKELREINLDTANVLQTPVVICYNLPPGVSVEQLFNLFSLYGTVLRIKILREKNDTALIQYSDPLYATISRSFLQNASIAGHEIQVRFSRNHEVKTPQSTSESFEDSQRNKVFMIKDQRYASNDIEKYVKGACKPTNTLFVANILPEITEDEILKIFSRYGSVTKWQFKSPKEGSQNRMLIIEMGSEAEALQALMNLHNFTLHSRDIKVAFSKTVLPSAEEPSTEA